MSEPRSVVIDTSTLVGAVLRPDSIPRRAFLAALDNFSLCVNRATVDELREVLHRPKFDRYAPLQNRVNFLAFLNPWQGISIWTPAAFLAQPGTL